MLIQDLSDKRNKIEIHQETADFTLAVNGYIVRKSQDMDTIIEDVINNLPQIIKAAKQIAKLAKIQTKYEVRVAQAQQVSRNEFIAAELIQKTCRSQGDRLVRRRNRNFDIQFMRQPVWSNIAKEDVEIWVGRSGLFEMGRNASMFWMDNQE